MSTLHNSQLNYLNCSALHSSLSLTNCSWNYRREFSLHELRSLCGATIDMSPVESHNDGGGGASAFTLSLPLHVVYLQRIPCPSSSATNNQLRWSHLFLSNVLQLSFLYDKFGSSTTTPHTNQLYEGGKDGYLFIFHGVPECFISVLDSQIRKRIDQIGRINN